MAANQRPRRPAPATTRVGVRSGPRRFQQRGQEFIGRALSSQTRISSHSSRNSVWWPCSISARCWRASGPQAGASSGSQGDGGGCGREPEDVRPAATAPSPRRAQQRAFAVVRIQRESSWPSASSPAGHSGACRSVPSRAQVTNPAMSLLYPQNAVTRSPRQALNGQN